MTETAPAAAWPDGQRHTCRPACFLPADLVDLPQRFAPNEAERRRILVENPTRLFGTGV
jgi:hypothetical protein